MIVTPVQCVARSRVRSTRFSKAHGDRRKRHWWFLSSESVRRGWVMWAESTAIEEDERLLALHVLALGHDIRNVEGCVKTHSLGGHGVVYAVAGELMDQWYVGSTRQSFVVDGVERSRDRMV